MVISRTWAMPSKDTFDVRPIGDFVKKYLAQSKISADMFARNKEWATYTNDLNPDTKAQFHMLALDFAGKMRDEGIRPDLVIFDPPYSLNQVKASYNGIGLPFTQYDTTHSVRWSDEKEILKDIMDVGSVFLHFGWHSNGMGKTRGFDIEELLLVAHGGAHYDTICIAERKIR